MDFTSLLIIFMLASVISGTLDEITYKKFCWSVQGSAERAHLNIMSQTWMYTRFTLFTITAIVNAVSNDSLPYSLHVVLSLMFGGNMAISIHDVRHRDYDDTFGSMLKRGLKRLVRALTPTTSPTLSPA